MIYSRISTNVHGHFLCLGSKAILIHLLLPQPLYIYIFPSAFCHSRFSIRPSTVRSSIYRLDPLSTEIDDRCVQNPTFYRIRLRNLFRTARRLSLFLRYILIVLRIYMLKYTFSQIKKCCSPRKKKTAIILHPEPKEVFCPRGSAVRVPCQRKRIIRRLECILGVLRDNHSLISLCSLSKERLKADSKFGLRRYIILCMSIAYGVFFH